MKKNLLKNPFVFLLFCTFLISCSSDDDFVSTEEEEEEEEIIGSTVNDDYTVGLLLNTEDAYDAYTLFSPIPSNNTYLINNCGEQMYSWESNYTPAHSFYLLENGYLLRPGNTNNANFNAGGQGGIIEMIDADGNVVWDYTISSSTECQHHDVEYLDNGNILAIVWDMKTSAEATAAGRTDYISEMWSEKIIEIKPNIEAGTAEIVWEWYAWDHIVQDENASADNYAVVSEHPELLNINFDYESDEEQDWLHFNAIDYNEDLDQILVSSRSYSEFFIIDHSTTTAQAASHTGGTYGKGGDFLYRWGNPQTYDMGDDNDQQLYNQHDANWINSSFEDGNMIMVFNNQAGSANGSNYSTVNVIDTQVNADGSYTITDEGTYDPAEFQWTYSASTPTDMYSAYISGARRLANGNTLICVGSTGTFKEVDYDGETVWEYINPISAAGIYDQYEVPSANIVFRAEKYDTDYIGLDTYELTNVGTIESGSDYTCE
ncbi:Arylsulfotransferase (ASST) [Mesonia phycicola]|uniref:Arylsulfotransferase (ASST) n=1 Tax=Mesonia phycicola TaxID=579105 RepID=A0A1M6G031_9FLAO|nr:aryl-sulfate sulfotransferase [Mesonia phycicola]SHJ03202.1 Arylsulfotransferase (ASST) [Mesonia phycicola]